MKKWNWLPVALMLSISAIAAPQYAAAKDTKPVASSVALLDLNTATVDQLNALPGIGAAKAKAIVEGRPYASIDDFLSKGIVSKSAYDKFKDQVTVAAGATPQPAKTAKSTTGQAGPLPAPVDLNTATIDQLNALPGIGPAKAKAIVEGRPYASADDLLSRKIVPKSAFDKFKDQVTVSNAASTAAPKKTAASTVPRKPSSGPVDLNTATADELTALPGIGAVKAKAIIEGRPYATVDDLASKGIVSKSTLDKFKDRVTIAAGQTRSASSSASSKVTDEATPPEPAGRIDLNTASVDELEALPGIGPVKAKAIVSGRPYASLAAFEAKGIVPKSTLDKLKDAIDIVPVAKASAGNSASGTAPQQGTPGQLAAQKRIKMCGAQWRAAKAAGEIPAGQKWPQYWSQCNSRLKTQGY